MSARSFAIVMAALAVIALLGFGLVTKGEGGITVGEPPAEGELPFLDPATSGTASLADYEGEWVLANVWASWCDPCREESPALQRFSERNEGRVTVIGIDTQDNTDDAREFVEEYGLTYTHLHDGSGDYADDLGATGVPETVLIDPEGNVAFHYPGVVDEQILRDQVEPLIDEDA